MFKSKKKTAIRALEIQKSLLEKSHQDNSWIAETSDMLRKYLGEKSELYLKMKSFDFGIWQEVGTSKERMLINLDMKRREAGKIVERSINFIKQHGIYTEPTAKPIAIIKANWLVALVFVLSPAIFKFGWWWGYDHDYKLQIEKIQQTNQRLKNEIHTLKDSILRR